MNGWAVITAHESSYRLRKVLANKMRGCPKGPKKKMSVKSKEVIRRRMKYFS